ncbi:unnamed protein product [Urochloa decumbens]|uniref:DUF4220 domain-containing protein n=1 Tax=Urochloa decumbens TaxID=240449 RepID=A0ABC9GBM1_9POAL
MGFNPPVPQQDSNWEIRVAVQVSLLLQVLLIFLGPVRRRSSGPWARIVVWSCYLLADWVADLALGLLLNTMGNIGGGSSSSSSSFGLKRGGGGGANAGNNDSSSPMIFAFWTPFLLLHLGGPDTITAYSMEDNELWNRHLIGLLFELFSAAVIILCSMRGGNHPLIPATLLMLVAGLIKYGERTYSLYSSSNESLRESILGPPDPGPNYSKLMTEIDAREKAGLVVEIAIGSSEKAADRLAMAQELYVGIMARKSVEARAYDLYLNFRPLFIDIILSSKQRRLSQAFFLEKDERDLTPSEAFEVIEVELNFIYDMLYTKAPVAHTRAGWVLRSVCSGCLVSALIIFFVLDKRRHNIQRVDVGITYALLLGGLALDAAALAMLLFSNRAAVYLEQESPEWLRWLGWLTRSAKLGRRWSGTTSQMNLIGYCLGKPERNSRRGRRLLMLADKLGLEDMVDDLFFIKRVPLKVDDQGSSFTLLDFIFKGLKEAAHKVKEKDEIMAICNRRGDGVIGHLEKDIKEALKTHYEWQMKKTLEKKEQRLVLEEQIKDALKNSSNKDRRLQAHIDLLKELLKINEDMMEQQQQHVLEEHIKEALKNKGGHLELDKIKQALKDYDKDQKFNLIRESLEKSLETKDFDESLLMWHVATDLCRFKDKLGPPAEVTARMQDISETLSEYMLYLLIKQPDMLSATGGIGMKAYRDTCAELRYFSSSMDAWVQTEDDIRVMLLRVNTSEKPSTVKGYRSKSVLFDAVILAKALRELDESLMWDVVTGAWGEMLTYAAGKCRGSTHVRKLNRSCELITLVWLLMQHMGLSDMYEIQEGDPTVKLIVRY